MQKIGNGAVVGKKEKSDDHFESPVIASSSIPHWIQTQKK